MGGVHDGAIGIINGDGAGGGSSVNDGGADGEEVACATGISDTDSTIGGRTRVRGR